MELKQEVKDIIDSYLEERRDLFLIELKSTPTNDFTVIIDGDHGVNIDDCLAMSRQIEGSLDREKEDFSLEVASAGLSEPLKLPRQYKKNVGRSLDLLLQDDSRLEGELKDADDKKIAVELRYRRPKLVGKGKENVIEERTLTFAEIKKALIKIKF